jgi:hypothetical protein
LNLGTVPSAWYFLFFLSFFIFVFMYHRQLPSTFVSTVTIIFWKFFRYQISLHVSRLDFNKCRDGKSNKQRIW